MVHLLLDSGSVGEVHLVTGTQSGVKRNGQAGLGSGSVVKLHLFTGTHSDAKSGRPGAGAVTCSVVSWPPPKPAVIPQVQLVKMMKNRQVHLMVVGPHGRERWL